MPTRVLLTVDTELVWRHYAQGFGWEENLRRSYAPAGVGVPWQLERLRDHGLKAVFFVDPMPAEVYGLEPVRRMVEPILEAGQEVQLHLHPNWRSVARGVSEGEKFELTCFTGPEQEELIAAARDLLIAAGAPRPIAFRSGTYAANAETIRALAALRFTFDSSHNGCEHPDPSDLPLPPRQVAPVSLDGVIEVPVSQIEEPGGRLRHLQLCALSSEEMEAALLHAAGEGHPVATIVSHSFELATRDGNRPNRSVCRRFERLCGFLADRRETLPTAWFADLADLPLGRPARPLPASRLRTVRRMVEQAWSNAVYERAF
jgi:peptidoglycan/xylan/chitin deacetylase (PgdA/CDA1 family)